MKSREGFQGCLASVDLDGDNRSLLEQGASILPDHKQDIVSGCEGLFKYVKCPRSLYFHVTVHMKTVT